MSRAGWTLHEMLISLSIMAVAAALAAHASVVQLRFFRGAGEIIATRGQLGSVGSIVAAALWGASPAGGDITLATDSALEVLTSVGNTVVCSSAPGRVVFPSAQASGNTLSGWVSAPDVGDVVRVYVADSAGTAWIGATVAAVESGGGCESPWPAAAPEVLVLREPLELPPGSVIHVARPLRFSHYRASDGLWYFGARDWNSAGHLNTVQPVAGPLASHSADASSSGLVLRYYDDGGAELAAPVDPARIANITVLARATTRRPVRVPGLSAQALLRPDSAFTVVSLRNRP